MVNDLESFLIFHIYLHCLDRSPFFPGRAQQHEIGVAAVDVHGNGTATGTSHDNIGLMPVELGLGGRKSGIEVIVTGVCETDFSGYPDCRDDTMKAMQVALSLGMDRKLLIETPLMWIDKAQTWQLAHDLGQQADPAQGGHALVDLIVEHSHTCYLGERTQRHDWGYGCGQCPACQLRASGFERWCLSRPTTLG